MTHILFACIGNSCRSQMAEGFCRRFGRDVICASAGSKPKTGVDANAIAAMSEQGIDITAHRPKPLLSLKDQGFDVIVTVGCGGACPFWPGAKLVEWEIPDACRAGLERTRAARDLIRTKVIALLRELDALEGVSK